MKHKLHKHRMVNEYGASNTPLALELNEKLLPFMDKVRQIGANPAICAEDWAFHRVAAEVGFWNARDVEYSLCNGEHSIDLYTIGSDTREFVERFVWRHDLCGFDELVAYSYAANYLACVLAQVQMEKARALRKSKKGVPPV